MSVTKHIASGVVLVVCWLLCWAGPIQAAEAVPLDRQATILLRALAYDRKLKKRAGTTMTLAVLSKPGSTGASRLLNGFKALEKLTVQGLPVRVVSLAFGPDLMARLAAEEIDAVYLDDGLAEILPEILAATRKAQVISIAAAEEYVEHGASMGVFISDGKPTIVVNVKASRAEGADLSSDLLGIARVVN